VGGDVAAEWTVVVDEGEDGFRVVDEDGGEEVVEEELSVVEGE